MIMTFNISKESKDLMEKYDKLMQTRLSPNYILRDFMFSSEAEILGIPNRPSDDVTIVIKSAKALCNEVLEPIRAHFGPISITFGYQSRDLIEAGMVKPKLNSSCPHQYDRGTFGSDIYARVDILPYCVETGEVSKLEFGKWMMYNLNIDLLMAWKKSNVFCVTISPKPRRVWLEWTPKGEGTNGSNKVEYMGASFWQSFNEKTCVDLPKFYPSETNGSMNWFNYK